MLKLSIQLSLLCILFVAAGCATKEYAHPSYGTQSENQAAFKAALEACEAAANEELPVIEPPVRPTYRYNPCGGGGGRMGKSESCRDPSNASQREYERKMDEYRKYNASREALIDKCLKGKGWQPK